MSYLPQEAFLFVVLVLIFLFANTWRALADYNLIRIGVTTLTIATLIWLVLRLTRRWTAPTPLSIPLLIFIIAYFIAALASIQPRRSFDEVWVFAMYAFSFALVAQLVANGWPREVFTKSILIAGGLLAGVSLWVASSWYRAWLEASPGQWIPNIAFRLPLANGQATYLYLLTFVALARLRVTRAFVPRILLTVWIFVAAILLYLTASRGGWFATGVGLLVMALLAIREAGGLTYIRNLIGAARQRWFVSLGVSVIGLLALAALVVLASYQVISPQKAAAAFARVEYWVPAWQTFLQRPLLGQGPLTFGSSYLRLNSVPPYGFFAHAHSIFFNLLSETGLVGIIAFGMLAFATFVALWQQVNRLTGEDRAVAIAALAGTSAWAVHSLVDTVNVEPMNSMLMVVLLGAALGGQHIVTIPQPNRWWTSTLNQIRISWPILLGLILSVTGFISIWRMTPMYDGLVASTRQQWPETAANFAEAVRRDPQNPIAHQQAGLAYSVLAKTEPARLSEAVAEFEQVVKLDPDWWLNHANLASLYQAQGDTDLALTEYREAVKIGSGSAMLWLNYGLATEAAGNLDEAQQAYFRALNIRPNWANAYLWRANEFRSSVLQTWRDQSPPSPVLTVPQMLVLATGGDRGSDYTPLAAEYIRLNRLDEAAVLLKKASLAYFDTGEARLEVDWLKAELAAAHGNWQAATEAGERAVEGYLLQSAFGPGDFGSAAYGQVFFRQSTMAMDLVPQLTRAPFTDAWAERLVTIGDWYIAAGDKAKAEAVYLRVLGLVPDNAVALERLGQ